MARDKRFSIYIALITGSLIMNSFTPIFAIENLNVASKETEQLQGESILEEEKESGENTQIEVQVEEELTKPSEENGERSTEQNEDELASDLDETNLIEEEQEKAEVLKEETIQDSEVLEEEIVKENIIEDSSSADEVIEEDVHLDDFPELEEYDRQETYDLAMQMMEEDQLSKQGPSMLGSFSNIGYIDHFLETIIPQAIEDSVQSRILPSITIAQAALESAWGQSGLAINANNLFGIKSSNDWKGQVYNIKTDEFAPAVYDSSGKLIKASYWYTVVAAFRKYENWLGSLKDHGDFFTSTEWRKNNYRFVIGEKNYKKAAQALLSSGYATDPGYANKLINIVDTYNLSKYDQLPVISSDYYVQNKGWANKKGNIVSIGTTGAGLQLQDMKFSIPGYDGVGINYSTFINNSGWTGSITSGNATGNAGKGKYIEAFKMNLDGENAKNFDILYRVHSQSSGWSGWAKNGQPAGRLGYGKRVEQMEVKIAWKGDIAGDSSSSSYQEYTSPHVVYSTHVESHGWKDSVQDGATSGTTGIKKRLEAITIAMNNTPYSGSINYQTHVQSHGWKQTVSNGAMSGTAGLGKRLEAIKIGLSGEMATHFDIYYRTHIQTYGWTGWAKNGSASGSEGLAKRLEAIEIVLVPKGQSAPGTINNSFYK